MPRWRIVNDDQTVRQRRQGGSQQGHRDKELRFHTRIKRDTPRLDVTATYGICQKYVMRSATCLTNSLAGNSLWGHPVFFIPLSLLFLVGSHLFSMIDVQSLTKLYGDFPAVRDLTFAVQPGEVLGLVGPNGAGKTTTLRCLAGIIPTTHGTIRIAGEDLKMSPMTAKRELAFFSDEPRLFDYLSVRQHLEFTARLYQVDDAEERSRVLLEQLDLRDKSQLLPNELSRGMKQKVALACGFLHRPRVMFFDEPLTGLDPLAIRKTKDLIIERAKEGVAILISSHLLHLLEELCTHVLILRRGEKAAHGTLQSVLAEYSNGSADTSLEDVFIRVAGEDAGG